MMKCWWESKLLLLDEVPAVCLQLSVSRGTPGKGSQDVSLHMKVGLLGSVWCSSWALSGPTDGSPGSILDIV